MNYSQWPEDNNLTKVVRCRQVGLKTSIWIVVGDRGQRGGGFTLRLASLLGVVSLRCLVVCKFAIYFVQLTSTFVSCTTSLAHLPATRHRKETSSLLETASGMSCWCRLHRAWRQRTPRSSAFFVVRTNVFPLHAVVLLEVKQSWDWKRNAHPIANNEDTQRNISFVLSLLYRLLFSPFVVCQSLYLLVSSLIKAWSQNTWDDKETDRQQRGRTRDKKISNPMFVVVFAFPFHGG